jgi:putative holliday junction resolvase
MPGSTHHSPLTNNMSTIMALDVGDKTIGVAVSDPSETFAFPRHTIMRQEGHRRDMAALRAVIEEDGIEEIVVGLPIMMDGSLGIQAEKVQDFIDILRRYVTIPISLQDERLSTSEVEKVLIAADRKRAERKSVIDAMAAGVILQSFLERRRREAVAR